MKLNFSDKRYFDAAQNVAKKSKEENGIKDFHQPEDAFLLLISGIEYKDLDNLCQKIKFYYPDLGIDECYELTQGKGKTFNNNSSIVKKVILQCANECLREGKYLGNNKTEDGVFNTSRWISHSLYEAKLSGELAYEFGLDVNRAKTLALLHDYGRKHTHKFEHVIKGFEELIDLGWINESTASLTHSFINGNRCACCDPSVNGIYINENGIPCWIGEEDKDDITLFLENYNYTLYDHILNIADLMSTSDRIVSPLERLEDILSRRNFPSEMDISFFLSEFTNKLNELMARMRKDYTYDKTTPLEGQDALKQKLKVASDNFYKTYHQIIENNKDI